MPGDPIQLLLGADHSRGARLEGDAIVVEGLAKQYPNGTEAVRGVSFTVPRGKRTDFFRAVDAADDETVCMSWVEWPDKATRDSGMKTVMSDPRLSPDANPMPFDGKRMIFGGFAPVVELDS